MNRMYEMHGICILCNCIYGSFSPKNSWNQNILMDQRCWIKLKFWRMIEKIFYFHQINFHWNRIPLKKSVCENRFWGMPMRIWFLLKKLLWTYSDRRFQLFIIEISFSLPRIFWSWHILFYRFHAQLMIIFKFVESKLLLTKLYYLKKPFVRHFVRYPSLHEDNAFSSLSTFTWILYGVHQQILVRDTFDSIQLYCILWLC